MKTYTEEKLQAAIDNAILLFGRENGKSWEQLADNRLAIAKTFLEKLESDPYAELKAAHAEGKVIQYQSANGSWHDLEDFDFCTLAENYRIKPEPETFEAHGKTWTRHNAGDAMPCDRKAQVEIIYGADNRWLSKQSAQWWNWISGTITGWRYANEPTVELLKVEPWTPAVGDVVQLKSGGPKMTIHFIDAKNAGCVTFTNTGEFTFATLPFACLTLVTE